MRRDKPDVSGHHGHPAQLDEHPTVDERHYSRNNGDRRANVGELPGDTGSSTNTRPHPGDFLTTCCPIMYIMSLNIACHRSQLRYPPGAHLPAPTNSLRSNLHPEPLERPDCRRPRPAVVPTPGRDPRPGHILRRWPARQAYVARPARSASPHRHLSPGSAPRGTDIRSGARGGGSMTNGARAGPAVTPTLPGHKTWFPGGTVRTAQRAGTRSRCGVGGCGNPAAGDSWGSSDTSHRPAHLGARSSLRRCMRQSEHWSV